MTDSAIQAATRQIISDNAVKPVIEAFFDEATFTVSYVVYDQESRKAAVIDSVQDFDQASGRTSKVSANTIIDFVTEHRLDVEWLLETHAHADHLSAAIYLQQKIGGKIAIGEHIDFIQRTFSKLFNATSEFDCDGSDFDQLFSDGDKFMLGNIQVTVLHLPGHTPACVAYVVGDAVFVGDTFFMPDYGTARADFPGGNARDLYRSLRRLMSLPETTRLLMCHDYKAEKRDIYAWETTVADQRKSNIHVHDGISEDEFVTMRNSRDAELSMPDLILPSVQVNMRAGRLPAAEDNGLSYLKIPIDAL